MSRRATLLAIAWLASAPAGVNADGLDRVPSGVVHLFIVADNKLVGTGSGFLVSENGHVVTNHHVIEPAGASGRALIMFDDRARALEPELRPLSMQEALPRIGAGLPVASLLWSDKTRDLAILQVAGAPSGASLAISDSRFVNPGDRVVAFGFPGLNLRLGPSAFVTLDRRSGEIASAQYFTDRKIAVYSTSANTYQGMSGGPVVNACGEVVAIVSMAFHRPLTQKDEATQKEQVMGSESVQIVLRTDELLPELESRGIAVSRASARCEPEVRRTDVAPILTERERDPLLVGGVIAAIALGLVGVALGFTRRGRAAVKQATDSVTRSLSRRERKAPGPDDRQRDLEGRDGALPSQPRASTPVLYGVSGEYAGVELEIGPDPVAIGRDPRVSQLVFSADTPGVSGRHCSIWFDVERQQVMVEDLWSTNGTFVNDARLEGGRPFPLRSSDQFHLGDPDVLFEVRY